MSEIRIFEPALCCATGVCGVDVDEELVRVSADIDSVKRQGGDVARFNMASEPGEFAADETVRSFLQVAGSDGLPLVLVDGVTVMTGRYPTREQLQAWACFTPAAFGATLPLAQEPDSGCCAGAEEQAAVTGDCCGGVDGGAQEPEPTTACCS